MLAVERSGLEDRAVAGASIRRGRTVDSYLNVVPQQDSAQMGRDGMGGDMPCSAMQNNTTRNLCRERDV